ncbi:MAG: hypothetical protein IKN17_05755, partial [Ruminococcus sp.]|nr:hypothetical protein [Ruminococcus sp.]
KVKPPGRRFVIFGKFARLCRGLIFHFAHKNHLYFEQFANSMNKTNQKPGYFSTLLTAGAPAGPDCV